jgi:uncharacterized membrane protein
MTFLSFIAFGKEFLVINDTLVIILVMTLLLIALIKTMSLFILDLFQTTKINSRNEFELVVNHLLAFVQSYRHNLKILIYLNLNRSILLPVFEDCADEFEPEPQIQ